jgi:ABC-type thiamine transport system ATPase subunit
MGYAHMTHKHNSQPCYILKILQCVTTRKRYYIIFNYNYIPKNYYAFSAHPVAGKTTILKIAGSFIRPNAGQVFIRSKPVQKPDPERIMIFQEHNQLFSMENSTAQCLFLA